MGEMSLAEMRKAVDSALAKSQEAEETEDINLVVSHVQEALDIMLEYAKQQIIKLAKERRKKEAEKIGR